MQPTLKGKDVFELYDTYGFPSDITAELAAGRGVAVEQEGFEAAMKVGAPAEPPRAGHAAPFWLSGAAAAGLLLQASCWRPVTCIRTLHQVPVGQIDFQHTARWATHLHGAVAATHGLYSTLWV